jgi:cytochrome c oxidase subunit 4
MEATHAAKHHESPNYIGIFWWLLALTIAEIAVIYAPVPKIAIAIMLIGMALTKAALVALYYMHLAFETRTLGVIALTPLILCVFLVFALTPDLGAVLRHSYKTEAPAEAGHH